MRGEFREAQEIAETMLHEAGAEAQGPEAGAFRRMLGLIRLYQGELKAAQTIFELELTGFELGPARQVNAAAFLALTEWHLGEVVRARQHIQQAVQWADEMGDVATVGTGLFFRTVLESRREDASATRLAVDALLELSQKHGMRTYSDEGRVYANWARGRLLDPDFGADKLERTLGAYIAQGNKADAPSLYGLLAELQADARELESALASIDQGLAIADETGEHFTDLYLHRLRGDLLLKRNCSDFCAGRRGLQGRDSCGEGAARAELRTPGVSPARQALPVDRPRCRSPRRSRTRARGLFADAGNAGDR